MKITKARLRQIIKEEYETMMGSDIEGFSDEDELGTTEPMRDTGLRSPAEKLLQRMDARSKLDQMSPEEREELAGGDAEVLQLIQGLMSNKMLDPRM